MIAPDMATMLSFVFTDVPIAAAVLQDLLQPQIDRSFNAITVDSDTSTSDTCLVFATGKATVAADRRGRRSARRDLRRGAGRRAARSRHADGPRRRGRDQAGDGQGRGRRPTIASAIRIAHSIANSPLVKTAIAGEDANWGRVVMAVGKAGEPADRDRLVHRVRRHPGCRARRARRGLRRGRRQRLHEGPGARSAVDLGLGPGSATVYTCDLTHGYIDINGSYRS